MNVKFLASSALIASLACISSAQMTLTARESYFQYQYVYGNGGEVFQDNQSVSNNDLLASDIGEKTVFESGSGANWAASVNFDGFHQYAVTGTVSDFSSVTMSGYAHTNTEITNATADIAGVNKLVLDFTLASDQLMSFSGEVAQFGPTNRNSADIFLYIWSDFWSDYVFHDVFGITPNAPFSSSYLLAANDYRIVMSSYSHATGHEHAGASSSFTMQAVPEPFTMIGLAAAAGILARRRRK